MSPRADAARNAARLLAAAREVFAEQGAEAALDDIARRAGVGNATLYRHFPTRGDLLVAVYAEEVEALVAEGATLPLFDWLDAFVVHVATKRTLALAINDNEHRGELFGRWHTSITATAQTLLERARRAGVVRDDVEIRDVLALTTGAAISGTSVEHARHLLTVLRYGLAPD
jgi:AcrR family transcriptional regulator